MQKSRKSLLDKNVDQIHPPRYNSTMRELQDNVLLSLIASRRDHAAFNEIYSRYHKPAYNLALRMSGGQVELALDAFQKSMIRVWKYAHTFKQEGNVRSWLLRVVAHQVISISRQSHSRARTEKPLTEHSTLSASGKSADQNGAENIELRQALVSLLDDLADPDRKLIALYFGAGLSQDEISKIMGTPQRTLSTRISHIIGTLRERLTKAGFGAAVASSEAIKDAILNGSSVPTGLHETIEQSLAIKSKSQFHAQPLGNRTALLLAGCLSIGLLTYVTITQTSSPILTEKTNSDFAETIPNIPETSEEESNLLYHWSPEMGSLKPFLTINGSWNLARKEANLSAGMESDGIMIVLPVQLPKGQFRIEITKTWPPNYRNEDFSGLSIHIGNETTFIECEFWRNIKFIKPTAIRDVEIYTAYLYASERSFHIAQILNNEHPLSIQVYEPLTFPIRPILFIQNARMHSIKIWRIEANEIPAPFQNKKAIKEIFTSRKGTIAPGGLYPKKNLGTLPLKNFDRIPMRTFLDIEQRRQGITGEEPDEVHQNEIKKPSP